MDLASTISRHPMSSLLFNSTCTDSSHTISPLVFHLFYMIVFLSDEKAIKFSAEPCSKPSAMYCHCAWSLSAVSKSGRCRYTHCDLSNSYPQKNPEMLQMLPEIWMRFAFEPLMSVRNAQHTCPIQLVDSIGDALSSQGAPSPSSQSCGQLISYN